MFVASSVGSKLAMLDSEPDKYFTTDHYGSSARLLVRLAAVDVDELRRLVVDSYRATQGGAG